MSGQKRLNKAIRNNRVVALPSKKIERPIDSDIIIAMCNIIKDTSHELLPEKLNTSTSELDSHFPVEKLSSLMIHWNSVADLFTELGNFIKDPLLNYGENVTLAFGTTASQLRGTGFKIRSLRRIIVAKLDEGSASLIPEFKSITDTTKE